MNNEIRIDGVLVGRINFFAMRHNPPLASWPADVQVAPRQARPPQPPPEGTEEGDLCLRHHPGVSGPCLGKLEMRRSTDAEMRGCYCHICPPCGTCMSVVPECPVCGHREPEPD